MGSTDDLDALLRPQPLDVVRGALRERLANRKLVVVTAVVVAVVLVALGLARGRRPVDPVEFLPSAAASATTSPPTSDTGAPGTGASDTGASDTGGGAPPTATPTSVPAVVHVAGAVETPGVVRVGAGARVIDAVTAAGGARSDADLDRVNLAAPVVDGSWIWVPSVGEQPPATVPVSNASTSTAAPGVASSAPGTKVNLNTASAEELQTLPGVGPATAAAIIAHRERVGPFAAPEDLVDVRGIGPAKLEALVELVTVG